jgi:hypothetical protein
VASARLVSSSAVTVVDVAPTDFDKDLNRLEAELKRLEAEYNMFFAGRLPRPPGRRAPAWPRSSSNTTAPRFRTPDTGSAFRRCSRGTRRSSTCGIAGCARAMRAGRTVRQEAADDAGT